MTTPAPFDTAKLLAQVAPCEYDGKLAQEGLRFVASARIYYNLLMAQNVSVEICWITVLNKLTDGAADWAGPHIISVAGGNAPWPDFAAFETAFKVHFCAADDEEAAVAELAKLCKASHRLGTVKDYTTQFNAIAAHTQFGDADKHERYHTALPHKIKDAFALTAHDISDLAKIQKVMLQIDQQLTMHEEEHPKPFRWKKKGEKAAASGSGKKKFNEDCWNCSEKGHPLFRCPKPKVEGQRAASSSSSNTDELTMLKAQLKAMEEKIAALTVVDKKEGF
ncbi:hypothetical protein LXA43DRAFT_1090093 [Ganoderma leucocontextum]|nr:hypothetical protein LXA43DRAFT_1090093 [Ganoderma leucocontextum]